MRTQCAGLIVRDALLHTQCAGLIVRDALVHTQCAGLIVRDALHCVRYTKMRTQCVHNVQG